MDLKSNFRKIQTFLEMIKFEHSVFALPFAYLGLFLAVEGMPDGFLFFWVTVAMVSFRTMAMSLNRLVDCAIDAQNPRTEKRALPAGALKKGTVWLAGLISLAVFEYSAYRLNPLCFSLSWIPVLLAWLYPYLKRFTWFSHGVLGIILGIAPYGAWLASRQEFSWIPGLLTLGVTAWVAGFDIIYALQDMEFDRRNGLHSVPSRFGQKAALSATKGLHAVAVLCWLLAGQLAGLGMIFYFGMAVSAGFLVWESWVVHRFQLAKIQQAFFTINAAVSLVVFVSVAMDYALRERIHG